MHVFRWDLDRTYLDTDITSVRGMIRTAFEQAAQKQSIPGAPALLRGLVDHDPGCRVAIISGSPIQMRDVLEEKLALDGIRFDALVLKDNLGNLRRGRFRAIRGQLGYKLPHLLEQRGGLGKGVRETLFGDDTEVDALVYALYAEAIAGRVSEDDLARVMEAGGAYPDSIDAALRALRRIGHADAVEDIFIHADRGIPLKAYRLMGERVIPVHSWFQAALVLWLRGRLGAAHVVEVARDCTNDDGMDEHALAALVQDLVRRRRIGPDAVRGLLDEAEGLASLGPIILQALDRLGPPPDAPPGRRRPDFLAFLRAIG